MKIILYFFILFDARFRYLLGFCPECNSDAPYLYSCPVCRYKKIDKKLWWDRWFVMYAYGLIDYGDGIKRCAWCKKLVSEVGEVNMDKHLQAHGKKINGR